MSENKPRIISRSIGRRKEAAASARLFTGSGQILINSKPIDQFFPGPTARSQYLRPFQVVSATKYDASVRVQGGGMVGQLGASVLALARALSKIKSDYHVLLRRAGLLTSDSRERQRRQVGTGGKARRRKQSPKR